MVGSHWLSTMSPQNNDMPGTISHHTANEPTQMMKAYFRPTIYPRPKTAAPVLTLNTSFALSAICCPRSKQRVVKFSFHHPKVLTMKS